MDQAVTASLSAAPASARPSRATLDRLTFLGWRGGLAAIIAGVVLSFVLFGYFAIYWRNADMDFMIVYNALVLNDGKPQEYFDHPSFFTILSVEYFFRLLHALGMLDADRLSAIPSASHGAAFDAAMTQAVRAGRVVALLTASAMILLFAALMRRAVRDWRVALLATLAFAFSGGMAVHARILRSELIAGSLATFALLVLIIAARRASQWRPLLLAAAAALCMLALENKVHAIVMIAAFPMLALTFGTPQGASVAFWRAPSRAWPVVLATLACAALLCGLAWPIVAAGIDPDNRAAAELHPLLFGRFGVYQGALLLTTWLAMAVFAKLYRVSAAETAAAMAAIVAGAAAGLLALDLQFNAGNAVAVVNPLEKMLGFAGLAPGGVSEAGHDLALLQDSFVAVLRRYSFFLYTSARPAIFLIWLIVPGIVYAWVVGRRQVALQATLMLLVATGIDTLSAVRYLKAEYFLLSDPFIIIAGALLLDALPQVAQMRGAYAIGLVLSLVHMVGSQPEPVKMMTKQSGPAYICEWNQIYEKQLPMPWCPLPPPKP
ncbi:hypothetical protein [Bradyrhizobium sp. 2TAF24]|uniref:hypothetical protein n=1 Tax=Bradyrhizobium sp. 2TAF24 TaxID=3233011 RepID=UPI003F917BC0